MKKTFKIILSSVAALALLFICSEAPDGGPSWANLAGIGALALSCWGLDRLGAFRGEI